MRAVAIALLLQTTLYKLQLPPWSSISMNSIDYPSLIAIMQRRSRSGAKSATPGMGIGQDMLATLGITCGCAK